MPTTKGGEPSGAALTMSRGASANTKTLPGLPTSCGRNWMSADALAEVAVMFVLTTIGKTGGGTFSVRIVPVNGLSGNWLQMEQVGLPIASVPVPVPAFQVPV